MRSISSNGSTQPTTENHACPLMNLSTLPHTTLIKITLLKYYYYTIIQSLLHQGIEEEQESQHLEFQG